MSSDSSDDTIQRGRAKVKLKDGTAWERDDVELYQGWVKIPGGGMGKWYPREDVEEVFFRA